MDLRICVVVLFTGFILGFIGKILPPIKLLSHDELSYKRNAPLLG